jgi:membrane-bound serine protease (ClpP class)
MNTLRWLLLLALALTSTAFANENASGKGPVIVVPVKTEISSAQFFFLRRALKEAERDGASAFVLDMETFGGEVKSALDNMDALLKTKVPTYTYINPRALSAGALIALATNKIYMSPTAVIGAAAPVMSTGEDLPKSMTDKTVSALSAMARAAAQQNGHNPELADAFISKEKEVKIGDVVIDKSDSLLTLSASEATKQYNGKPLLAIGVADNLEEMLKKEGLVAEFRRVEPSGFERVAIWITALAPVLLLGGIIGAYVEFKTPGFGIPGFISIVCFTLFFTGHYIAGLSGWEVMIAFAVGLALVIAEFFVMPGTVLPGVAGVVLMLGSVLYAMIDRWPSEPWWPSNEMLVRPMVNLAVALIAAAILGYFLAKTLPRTSFYRHIVLAADSPSGPGAKIIEERMRLVAGTVGTTRTPLRPAGKAVFAGELLDVVSQGEFIDVNAPVRIVTIDGTRTIVEPAPSTASV